MRIPKNENLTIAIICLSQHCYRTSPTIRFHRRWYFEVSPFLATQHILIFRYTNHSVEPCDNFYRHVCSFDSPDSPVSEAMKPVFDFTQQNQNDSWWDQLDIIVCRKIFSYINMHLFSRQLSACSKKMNSQQYSTMQHHS